jgi:YHS domain-containing protein
MPTSPRVETESFEKRQPRVDRQRSLDRRSFLKASAAAVGAAVGIAAGGSLPGEGAAFADEATTGKKELPAKSLRAARCPVTGEKVSSEAVIDYRGGLLYFCSPECIEKFRADRDQYEARANAQLVSTGQFEQTQCPLTGEEFTARHKMRVCGVSVCFSSAECLKQLKRASADERAAMVFGEGFLKGFAMKQEGKPASASNKWQCVVCGYVHTGSAPPATCQKCGAKSDSFVPMG